MARFLKHTSCDQCGSSDAKGIYDDGSSFCFSCKHSSSPNFLGNFRTPIRAGPPRTRILPDDLCHHFTGAAMGWLSKTGIPVETLIKHHVSYSPSRQQIIFSWPNTDLWQARNCSPSSKVRYFTSGSHDNVCPIYHGAFGFSRCVLTEDCLSSIKIVESGSGCDAMPLLGSHLSSHKMKALNNSYDRVDVFLDEDKYADALRLSSRLRMMGLESKAYLNVLDPKLIPYEDLKEILNA